MYNKKFSLLFFLLITAAVLLTFVSLFLTSGNFLISTNPNAIDFVAFYTGAKLFLQNPQQLYDLHLQQLIQQHVLQITKTNYFFLPFLNPPFVVLLFLPFVFLPIATAYALWVCTNISILLFFCFVAFKQTKKLKLHYRILFLFCMISFIPALTTVMIGQISLLLCLIFFGSWYLLQRNKLFLSGLCFSLLLIKPHFLLVPLLAFVIQRNKYFLRGFLTGIVSLFIISFLLVGENGIQMYIKLIGDATSWNTDYQIDLLAQHSLQTLLLFLFHTNDLAVIRPLWYFTIVFCILPLLMMWHKTYPPKSERNAMQWAVLLMVTLLTSPHTHFHDLAMLLVMPLIFSRFTGIIVLFFVAGYSLQIVGFMFEVWSNKHSDPVWIICNVIFLIIFSLFLWRKTTLDMLRYKL